MQHSCAPCTCRRGRRSCSAGATAEGSVRRTFKFAELQRHEPKLNLIAAVFSTRQPRVASLPSIGGTGRCRRAACPPSAIAAASHSIQVEHSEHTVVDALVVTLPGETQLELLAVGGTRHAPPMPPTPLRLAHTMLILTLYSW